MGNSGLSKMKLTEGFEIINKAGLFFPDFKQWKQQILDDYEKARKYDKLKEDYDELVLEFKEESTRGE